ncbi:unnamed protein product [Dimorphilus gyrociliatus]|uniref:Uncharacterized protein n=1 Tax=Dimorphilus gyrociliatus TaxID=2664684 RepID=A0A7I8VWS2_9ANNE|nr:unnamed protein product [Dimorphilus gyrociliatus]
MIMYEDALCPAVSPCVCRGSVTIDCSSQRLVALPMFITMTSTFKLLDLSLNHLGELKENSFEDVQAERIDLSFNDIAILYTKTFEKSRKLKFLNLNHNLLQTLPIGFGKLLRQLTTLLLKFNSFTNFLPEWFDGFTNLKFLDLSGNQLGFIPTPALRKLESLSTLTLRQIGLSKIPRDAFKGVKVEILNLGNNKDIKIEKDSFCGIDPQTSILRLDHSHIRQIPVGCILKLVESVRLLDLSGNPLHCDCSVLSANLFYAISLGTIAQCASPKKFAGELVQRVNSTQCQVRSGQCIDSCSESRSSSYQIMSIYVFVICLGLTYFNYD